MERHARIGHRIVADSRPAATTLACVRHHHERWDGGGYPEGLAGEEIPLAARIVAIVDVWTRSRRRARTSRLPAERVREILRKDRGTNSTRSLVDLFLRILDEVGRGDARAGGLPAPSASHEAPRTLCIACSGPLAAPRGRSAVGRRGWRLSRRRPRRHPDDAALIPAHSSVRNSSAAKPMRRS